MTAELPGKTVRRRLAALTLRLLLCRVRAPLQQIMLFVEIVAGDGYAARNSGALPDWRRGIVMEKPYRLWVAIVSKLQSPFLLIIRLYWGWQFFAAGRAKLTDIDKFAGYFANWGIPMPKLNVILAGSTECFGGLRGCCPSRSAP